MTFRLQCLLVVAALVAGCGAGEEPAVGFDKDGLHGYLSPLRNQCEPAFETVDRLGARTCALREHQQRPACLQVADRKSHHIAGRVIANVARQSRAAAEDGAVPNLRFHDAAGLWDARQHEHCIEQAGMVRGHDEPVLLAQPVQRGEIEAYQPACPQQSEKTAKDQADRTPPEPYAQASRQQQREDRAD